MRLKLGGTPTEVIIRKTHFGVEGDFKCHFPMFREPRMKLHSPQVYWGGGEISETEISKPG